MELYSTTKYIILFLKISDIVLHHHCVMKALKNCLNTYLPQVCSFHLDSFILPFSTELGTKVEWLVMFTYLIPLFSTEALTF